MLLVQSRGGGSAPDWQVETEDPDDTPDAATCNTGFEAGLSAPGTRSHDEPA
jgi:hypothetical protein